MLLCGSSGFTDQRKHAVGAGCVLYTDAMDFHVAAAAVGLTLECMTLRPSTVNMRSWLLIM